MDADGRIIPIVEDDQGEGMKDIYEPDDELRVKQLKALFDSIQKKHAKK